MVVDEDTRRTLDVGTLDAEVFVAIALALRTACMQLPADRCSGRLLLLLPIPRPEKELVFMEARSVDRLKQCTSFLFADGRRAKLIKL